VGVAVLIPGPTRPSAAAPGDTDTLIFSDAELKKALDVITERRPKMVLIEEQFASTAVGAGLMERIKSDAALKGVEIHVIAFGNAPNPGPVDMSGTRRAPRFSMAKAMDVDVDGKPASLVNLSIVGAQVVSPTIVKPTQRVRLTLVDEGRAIKLQSRVASVSVEIIKGAPRYRAGLEFVGPDQAALQQFIEKNRK
jgi:hypothetical protein